jgi:IS1 family transposase
MGKRQCSPGAQASLCLPQWAILNMSLARLGCTRCQYCSCSRHEQYWFIITSLNRVWPRRSALRLRLAQYKWDGGICAKKHQQCLPDELEVGDCWIGISLADTSGLILAARVSRHTDELIEEWVVSTEGKTNCKRWNSDDWGGYERVLPPEILHYIGKDETQRWERTNGIVRPQTGRWHRRQNKFGKLWEQTKVTTRLVVSYFNWIWQHSRFKTTAAQRANLTDQPWRWQDIVTYPTVIWCTTSNCSWAT